MCPHALESPILAAIQKLPSHCADLDPSLPYRVLAIAIGKKGIYERDYGQQKGRSHAGNGLLRVLWMAIMVSQLLIIVKPLQSVEGFSIVSSMLARCRSNVSV